MPVMVSMQNMLKCANCESLKFLAFFLTNLMKLHDFFDAHRSAPKSQLLIFLEEYAHSWIELSNFDRFEKHVPFKSYGGR